MNFRESRSGSGKKDRLSLGGEKKNIVYSNFDTRSFRQKRQKQKDGIF